MPRRTPILLAVIIVVVVTGGAYLTIILQGQPSLTSSANTSSSPHQAGISQSREIRNNISVIGISLCASNCVYPAPHLSALVIINGSVLLSILKVYVNNTYDGIAYQNPRTDTVGPCYAASNRTCSFELGGSGYISGNHTSLSTDYATCYVPASQNSCFATVTGGTSTLTAFALEYKGSVPNEFIPVVVGDKYVIMFVATFQDGSTATATASIIAT